jgi:hypothetical protein
MRHMLVIHTRPTRMPVMCMRPTRMRPTRMPVMRMQPMRMCGDLLMNMPVLLPLRQ